MLYACIYVCKCVGMHIYIYMYIRTYVCKYEQTYVCVYIYVCMDLCVYIYRMSQREFARLREVVPYVKLYRYNPKQLCPKLNGYRDNGQRILNLSHLLHTY